MLVLVGPPWAGTDEDYARLARAAGLVAYDLRARLNPHSWGVVRALAEASQAEALAGQLSAAGFRACVVDPRVGVDPARPLVTVRGLELTDEQLVLHLSERSIPVPTRGLVVVVRGEVQLGSRSAPSRSSSSSAFRAVAPSAADIQLFRESVASGQFDAYAAADIHFATVAWGARIDARAFDFSSLGLGSDSPAQNLDEVVEVLSGRVGVRVDRGGRTSSILSYLSGPARSATPVPGQGLHRPPPGTTDERFDAYSRIVAEAERRTRGWSGAAG
ncbi:MAG: hypothetical protein KF718_09515 [Polyangiaceae bacterium]|nr:hypothetical protein [Polyangiaceae bacterium]